MLGKIKSIGSGNRLKALVGIPLLVVGTVAALELTDTTHIFHKEPAPATTIPATSKKSDQSGASDNSGETSSGATDINSNKYAGSNAGLGSSKNLARPYGSFVSNHRPGQGGSGTKEQSACNTTPGAKCYIKFTNTDTGTVYKLPEQTVGSNGSTLWSWDAKVLGPGSWEITTVANLNGQTKAATDDIKLKVP